MTKPNAAAAQTAAAHPAKVSKNVTGVVAVLTLVGMVTGFQTAADELAAATAVVPEKATAFADATRLIIPHPVAVPASPAAAQPATAGTPAATQASVPAAQPNATSAGSGG